MPTEDFGNREHEHEYRVEYLPYGDLTTCASCSYRHYFSIGD